MRPDAGPVGNQVHRAGSIFDAIGELCASGHEKIPVYGQLAPCTASELAAGCVTCGSTG
jgi:hypothetical protein